MQQAEVFDPEQLVGSNATTGAHRGTFERFSSALFARIFHYSEPKLTVIIKQSEDLNDP